MSQPDTLNQRLGSIPQYCQKTRACSTLRTTVPGNCAVNALQASWSRMSTNRSMSRGATGELGSRAGTQNLSVAGSGWTDDSSRSSTVFTAVHAEGQGIVLFHRALPAASSTFLIRATHLSTSVFAFWFAECCMYSWSTGLTFCGATASLLSVNAAVFIGFSGA